MAKPVASYLIDITPNINNSKLKKQTEKLKKVTNNAKKNAKNVGMGFEQGFSTGIKNTTKKLTSFASKAKKIIGIGLIGSVVGAFTLANKELDSLLGRLEGDKEKLRVLRQIKGLDPTVSGVDLATIATFLESRGVDPDEISGALEQISSILGDPNRKQQTQTLRDLGVDATVSGFIKLLTQISQDIASPQATEEQRAGLIKFVGENFGAVVAEKLIGQFNQKNVAGELADIRESLIKTLLTETKGGKAIVPQLTSESEKKANEIIESQLDPSRGGIDRVIQAKVASEFASTFNLSRELEQQNLNNLNNLFVQQQQRLLNSAENIGTLSKSAELSARAVNTFTGSIKDGTTSTLEFFEKLDKFLSQVPISNAESREAE